MLPSAALGQDSFWDTTPELERNVRLDWTVHAFGSTTTTRRRKDRAILMLRKASAACEKPVPGFAHGA